MTVADRARKALEGITPGEWSRAKRGGRSIMSTSGKRVAWASVNDYGDPILCIPNRDFRFFAAAPQLVRDLLAENEALQSHLALYEGTTGQPISNTGLIDDLAGTVQALADQVRAADNLEKGTFSND